MALDDEGHKYTQIQGNNFSGPRGLLEQKRREDLLDASYGTSSKRSHGSLNYSTGSDARPKGFQASDIAALLQAAGGDPHVQEYIRARLEGQATPALSYMGNFNRMKQAAAFNPDPAPVNRQGRAAGGGSTHAGMPKVKPQGESYQFRDRYQDNRQFNNRQRSMNQDVDQADRMNQIKLSLLQKLMGQGGYAGSNMFKTSTDSTREELFNNAGGPQAVPLKQHTVTQNSFSPQDILALFR